MTWLAHVLPLPLLQGEKAKARLLADDRDQAQGQVVPATTAEAAPRRLVAGQSPST